MKPEIIITISILMLGLIAIGCWFIVSEVENSVKLAYQKGLADAKLPCDCSEKTAMGFNQGYSKAISDTQNATLLVGYCAAQQEAVKNGFILANNTTLVTPTSILKSVCFR